MLVNVAYLISRLQNRLLLVAGNVLLCRRKVQHKYLKNQTMLSLLDFLANVQVSIKQRHKSDKQATGLDAWASRVKCPARFVSHLHEICIYMSCL